MATYKVIQDIEAEDKLIGPLSLRQFIYALIAALFLYLSFLGLTKHAQFLLVVFVPVALVAGFFAFPFGQDQPTEVWALAKVRFLVKPRRRIWDQSGVKDLVTVTAPRVVERALTNGLQPDEVHSRLRALASTIDSRGWAVKNVNVSLGTNQGALAADTSDRLVPAASLPQPVSDVDVRASDDILDETANPVAHQFDAMINAAAATHRQQMIAQMQQPAVAAPARPAAPAGSGATAGQPPADYWFLQTPAAAGPGQATFADAPVIVPNVGAPVPASAPATTPSMPQAAAPTADEEALLAKLKATAMAPAPIPAGLTGSAWPATDAGPAGQAPQPTVTPGAQAAIMNLASNDDLDVATIARQAREAMQGDADEVVISLR